MKFLRALVLALALYALTASPVAAGYPGGKYGTDGTLTFVGYIDNDADGALSWNDSVTFSATKPSLAPNWGDIYVYCYYGWTSTRSKGTLVYTASWWLSTFPLSRTYRLDSQAWADNTGATCEAGGYFTDGRRTYTFATTTFTVAP